MEKNNFLKELNVGIDAFNDAKRAIQTYYGVDFSIDYKKDGSPVTSADKVANDIIMSALRKNFPGDGIISEESDNVTGNERTWYIDPIDGTKQFVSHSDQFAVHIGLCVGTEPVLGIVGKPLTGEIYYAIRNEGAYRQNMDMSKTKLQVTDIRGDSGLVAATSLTWDDHEYTAGILDALSSKGVVKTGSQGLRMMKIAENIADMWFPDGKYKARTNTWDICAPQIILEEAGGVVSYSDGSTIRYTGQRQYEKHIIAARDRKTLERVISTIN